MHIVDNLTTYVGNEEKSLIKILNHSRHYSDFEILDSYHYAFFKEYFGSDEGLGVTHYFVEHGYISRDFILDYSQYYSLCYQQYDRKCKRVHFFKDFGVQDFHAALERGFTESNDDSFWEKHYLGFVVIKPIPGSFIGFSLLKTYNYLENSPPYDSNRDYWAIRQYKIHIYGREVPIESIAFQQQDTVLSACATVSIWVMLHRASIDPIIPLKPPGAITVEAGITSEQGNRLIPNKDGLSILAMSEAITKNGLMTEVRIRNGISPDDMETGKGYNDKFLSYMKRLIYAYSTLRLPIILAPRVILDGIYGGHAVAICGHRMDAGINDIADPDYVEIVNGEEQSMIHWKALQMDQIYVHDDQIGPFSRMELLENGELYSYWDEKEQEDGHEGYSIPVGLILTVFQKVRVSYEDITNIVLGVNEIIIGLIGHELIGKNVWSIQLRYSEEYKREMINLEHNGTTLLNDDEIVILRKRDFPKYIWVAGLYSGEYKVIDFLFDATDYNEGLLGLGTINFYPKLCKRLGNRIKRVFVRNPELLDGLDKPISFRYVKHIATQLTI